MRDTSETAVLKIEIEIEIEILCIFNAILSPLTTKTPTVLHISQLHIHTRCILGNGIIPDGHDSFPVTESPFDNRRRCWDNMVLLGQALASTPPARQANKDFPIEASRYLAASDFPASPRPPGVFLPQERRLAVPMRSETETNEYDFFLAASVDA